MEVVEKIVDIFDCDCQNPIQIYLGKQFESGIKKIIFDVSSLISVYGLGSIEIVHKNPDDVEYPVVIEKISDSEYAWEIKTADTYKNGFGEIQLTYFVDDAKKKTTTIQTVIDKSIGVLSVAPDVVRPYLDQITEIGAQVKTDKEITEEYKNSAKDSADRAEEAARQLENIALDEVNIALDEVTVSRNESNEIQSIGTVLISGGIQKYWKGTREEFDAIENKDNDTLYEILDDDEHVLFEVDGNSLEFANSNENSNSAYSTRILRIPNNIDLMFQSILYGNGESGFRKYRNGCIEQWGVATSGANGEVEFNMHQNHIDTNFSVFVTPREKGNFFFYAVPTANQKFATRIQTKDGNNIAVKFQWRSWGRWK